MNNEDLETIIREVYSCYDVRYGNAIVDLKQRIDEAIEHIEHELNGHILLNDEITWNEEYYTNGKLDYRKLLISLLQQTLDILKGSDKE